jgi:alkylation response protein AidB-like acyl-CoA dehydrogenase
MDFDLSVEQREIQATAKELLTARCSPGVVRAAAEARGQDDALWQEVSRLGWPGIAIAERHGGQGLGLVELCVILEQAGAALAPIPLLPSVGAALMISLAGSEEQQARWLGALAHGDARGAVGIGGDRGLIAGAPRADVVVVVDEQAAGSLFDAANVPIHERAGGALFDATDAPIQPLRSIDPLRSYSVMRAGGDLGHGQRGEPLPGDVDGAASRVAVAVAAECVGVCERALEMTLAYVKERRQFGVPVGSFQAVSHRCAEMLLHTEQARSAVYFAAWASDADPSQLQAAAALAKALASEAALSVTASAIQAHGGIGFTWEADVHWLYKRAQLNAQLMGGAGEHRRRLAQTLGIAASG